MASLPTLASGKCWGAIYRAAIGRGLSMPKIIDILLEEHQNIEKLLLVLEHELEVFDRSGRPDYEILLFPAALKALRSEDWAEIDARLDDRKDPLFDSVVEEKFQNLQKTILRWERDTAETRLAINQTQP
jgi:hemerythrin-like domain-containing protein